MLNPIDRHTTFASASREVSRVISHIGKEANRLDDTLIGLVADQDETLNNYDDAERAYFRDHIVPALRELGIRETARRTGQSVGAVHAALAKGSYPRRTSRARYMAVADDLSGLNAGLRTSAES
jgi:hypothetical protein